MKKIIAFSGSNSSQSINQALIRYVADVMNQIPDVSVTVLDIRDYPLPMYSIDIEQASGIPDNAKLLQQQLFAHDALIIASPEHNGSMPAVLKNTIDWLSRGVASRQPFFGEAVKPVFLLSASPGAGGGATNLDNMATLMPWWGARVYDQYSLGNFSQHFNDGKLDAAIADELIPKLNGFAASIEV